MKIFSGFPDGKIRLTQVPSQFFRDLLPEISHLGELKLTLYLFWRLDRMDSNYRYLRYQDFTGDELFMHGLGATPQAAEAELGQALQLAVERGTLLKVNLQTGAQVEPYYFLNSSKGRAGAQAMERGDWRTTADPQSPVELAMETSNIYRLYEENFGPLTPMLAEALNEAENTYPAAWIEAAIRIALENNKRSWRYVTAILERWQLEGPNAQQDRRDTEKSRRRYAEWGKTE